MRIIHDVVIIEPWQYPLELSLLNWCMVLDNLDSQLIPHLLLSIGLA
jgi:hypothetical protein